MLRTQFAAVSTSYLNNLDARNVCIVLAAAVLAVAPLELSHLISMAIGALGFLLIQALRPKIPKAAQPKAPSDAKPAVPQLRPPPGLTRMSPCRSMAASTPLRRGQASIPTVQAAAAPRQEVRKPSAVPVQAPVFAARGWEAEILELLGRISPTPQSEAAVASIARMVQRAIRPILPEAEVAGFASSNPLNGTAFGVAVPEVDIVISVSPTTAQGRLQERFGPYRSSTNALDVRKLQKSAIRACTDRLVASGAFKFRRSAFRGSEPKVTLIALLAPEVSEGLLTATSIPINISVNALTPLHSAALLTECGQIEPRAKALILLVRRWAKDRGLSHAAKGHLSPYCWALLCIFYLQAGLDEEEGALLPPIDGFAMSSSLAGKSSSPRAAVQGVCDKQVGDLFAGFVKFYSKTFNWSKEAISVRLGRRAPPEVTLPLHIVLHEDGHTTEVGPSIEDPFEHGSNLGACTTAASLARLREELDRAHGFCCSGASLSELLEPWSPPEAIGAAEEQDE